MLDVAVSWVIPGYRTVCYVEREAYAAAILAARMEEGRLDKAPIWDDLSTFDPQPWNGIVDCITAGFPCQPHSFAGQRMGLNDDRWLWPIIAETVRSIRPKIVFLENVPGLINTGGLSAILKDLATFGYDAEWGVLSAADVGAPHFRERIWIVAADIRTRGVDWIRSILRGNPTGGWNGHQGTDGNADNIGQNVWWIWDNWKDCPGTIKPTIHGMDDGMANRVDRIRLTGNGVVPQCASTALRLLLARFLL